MDINPQYKSADSYGVRPHRDYLYKIYLPYYDGDKVKLPPLGCSLLNFVRLGRQSKMTILALANKGSHRAKLAINYIPIWHRYEFATRLVSGLGISYKTALRISNMSLGDIRHIEGCIESLVDNLLLSVPTFFKSDIRGRNLVRRVYNVASVPSGYERIIEYWKDFSSYVRLHACRARGEASHVLMKSNPFSTYARTIPFLQRVVKKGVESKRDMEMLAHLTSTRNFPCGGSRATKKALHGFFNATTTDFPLSIEVAKEIRKTAKRLGTESRRLLNDQLPFSAVHISLNSAGDYETVADKGGRGERIRQEIEQVLLHVPEESDVIKLPLGITVIDQKGVPRWKTWMRTHHPFNSDRPDAIFGSLRMDSHEFCFNNRSWGHDEVLGYQILAVALLKAKEFGVFDSDNTLKQEIPPIPARVAAPPEPGGKSRIVTTTLWWVILLQQPLGHFLKECLRANPRASDGLVRENQAWLFVNALSKTGLEAIPDTYQVLFSDLKNATDNIPKPTIRALIDGFAEGIGLLEFRAHPLFRLGMELALSTREFHMTHRVPPIPSVFTGVRGIMMGEPVTKAVLTLLNLAVEESAIWNGWVVKSPFHLPLYPLWRCYRIGGDDHAALGPVEYLAAISENHRKWGSVLSESKHASSAIGGFYCEDPLYFHGTSFKFQTREINRKRENYDKCVYVDSIKMRLLAPFSKVIETSNERNIAIGKAAGLGKRLRWMSQEIFPRTWKVMVRNRFFQRMRKHLPVNYEERMFLLFPGKLGGLGLYLDLEELSNVWQELPGVCQASIYAFVEQPSHHLSRILSGFCSSNTQRGYTLNDAFLQFATEYDPMNLAASICLPIPEQDTVGEVTKRFKISKEWSDRETLQILETKGWYTFDGFIDRISRSILFSGILNKRVTFNRFGTQSWASRFDKLKEFMGTHYPDLLKPNALPTQLSVAFMRRAELLLEFGSIPVYNMDVEEEVEVVNPFSGQTYTASHTLLEFLESGMPALQIPEVSDFTDPVFDTDFWETCKVPRYRVTTTRLVGIGFVPAKRQSDLEIESDIESSVKSLRI